MRATTALPLIAIALPAALLAASLTGAAPTALIEQGSTNHVEVTVDQDLGVVAGLVTTSSEGPLGVELDREPTRTGWVVLAPEDATVGEEPLTVTEETPFEDPNGGTWLSREVTTGETTAWAVPLDEAREDPTLGSTYNFAAIVDFSQLEEGTTLTASYHETLALEEPEGHESASEAGSR